MDARSYWSQLILWAAMGVCVGVSIVARIPGGASALPWSIVELGIALGACAYVAFSDLGNHVPVSMRNLQRVLYPVALLAIVIVATSFLATHRV
jgi:hypothetical protein